MNAVDCVDLCSSGVTQRDSVAVLLPMMLSFSADSVSLCLAPFSSFNAKDSCEARDPEVSVESLPDRGRRQV